MKFLVRKLIEKFVGMIDDISIVAAAEPFVCCDENKANLFDLALDKQGMANGGERRSQGFHKFSDLLGVGPCRTESDLRPFVAGDSDHLHRAGDLLDTDDASNSSLDFFRSEHLFKTSMEEWNVGILE